MLMHIGTSSAMAWPNVACRLGTATGATVTLIHSGFAKKLGAKRKTWKRRHFRLFSDGLLTYSKSSDDDSKIYGELRMSEVRTVRSGLQTDWAKLGADCPKEAVPDCRIEVVTDNRTLRFFAESKEEAVAWQQHLLKLKQVGGLKSGDLCPISLIRIRIHQPESVLVLGDRLFCACVLICCARWENCGT